MIRTGFAFALVTLSAWPVVAQNRLQPAELPPASYAGQQYVDSKGCAFLRAGDGRDVNWVPRVSREGKPFCSYPPSGRRVPVAEEVGVQPAKPAATPEPEQAAAPPTETEAAPGGYFVAVGSFGVAANVDRAEARLRALGYGVVLGRLQSAASSLVTVYAGPFSGADAANAARQTLRGDGFPDAVVIAP